MPHRNFTGFDPSPFSDPQLDSVQPALLDEVAPEENGAFATGKSSSQLPWLPFFSMRKSWDNPWEN